MSADATDPAFRQTALIRTTMFAQAEAAKALLAARAKVEHGGAPDRDIVERFIEHGDVNGPAVMRRRGSRRR